MSDRAAQVAISWHLREVNLGGTGVSGYLFLNGEQLDTAVISGGDNIGVKRTKVASIKAGDVIDLACGPQGDALCSDATDPSDGADGSFMILRISTVIPPAPPAPPTVIADSESDWSPTGIQGEKSWHYGYYDERLDVETGNKVYDPDDFIEFLNDGSNVVSADGAIGAWKSSTNHWNGGGWDLLNNGTPATQHGPWTELGCGGGHPAANAQGDLEVHWTLRRWVSTASGPVKIGGFYHCPAPCGDGTVGRILQNGTLLAAMHSQGNGIRYSVKATLSVGDILDFAIDPDGAGTLATPAGINGVNDGCDSTTFTAQITSTVQEARFHRGDSDNNGQLQLTDAVRILGYLFLGQTAPTCFDAADADGNNQLQLTDAVRILGYLFLGQTAPVSPGPPPAACGPDNDATHLGCATYTQCGA
jgi:hypothetical protein